MTQPQWNNIRKCILDDVHAYQGGLEFTPRTRGFIVGFINGTLEQLGVQDVDKWRYGIISLLFAEELGVKVVTTSKQLLEPHLYALYQWAKPFKSEDDGLWLSGNDQFSSELMVLYRYVKEQEDSILEALGWNG